MGPPRNGDDWLEVGPDPLLAAEAMAWAGMPSCGAVVVFCGTVRDHAEGRRGVRGLEYEAYESQVVPKMEAIAREARHRWPLGRLALLHRVGPLAVGDVSVVVVASAAHRNEAFEAARFAIDMLKTAVPIWKRETWAEGSDWGIGSQPVREVSA